MEIKYLIIIIAVVAIGLAIGISLVVLHSRKKKKGQEILPAYVKGLNYMIEGDLERAIECFKATVRADTDNIDAYIKLGDIMRRQNRLETATKIHRELLIRKELTLPLRKEILRSLIEDYKESRFYDKALQAIEELIKLDSKDLWAREVQLQVYEAKGDWDKAFEALRNLRRLKQAKEQYDDLLALYKVEAAQKLFRKGKEKEGRIRLREALKIDPVCVSAYFYLGDSYIRENRAEDAIEVWRKFVRKLPQYSHLVFDRLREVLFRIGSFGELETILQELHSENPDNQEVAFALVELKESKGAIREAVDLCEQILEKDPNSSRARMYLIRLYSRKGDKSKALSLTMDFVQQNLSAPTFYECQVCGYRSQSPLWHCPKCGAWKSFNIERRLFKIN
ncbi:hypothetical protein DRP98_06015 [candidate division KSB1 bacterium]|nr:MAG: hypothetical protein DRQ12_06215 [candidate division KSB1 bacterium]RKY80394.1 MAG: hypothetical protein DRQ00_02095 [candidate division KSB1 bacterium]RKY83966.1 MAG: hypothetical protein DRP98_06015 [candidate division KSB1 bacterium]HDI51977.1 tetratricopeptide repeat protein [Bacteroidota bacterium]